MSEQKKLYNIYYKLNKYKHKVGKDIYLIKYNQYKNLLKQNGGKLIDKYLFFDKIQQSDIDSLLIKYENEIKDLILSRIPTPLIQKDVLGCGANGCVFLLTDDAIIKIIFSLESYKKEKENNDEINKLSGISPFFPKFKCMTQHKIDKIEIGIIVSQKLYPINLLFDFVNHKFTNINFEKPFYSQLWFIYYMLYEFYQKTKIIILHNDIKIDNFMLREISDLNVNYVYNNGLKNIDIPYIIINNKKYILTIIDFGESYMFDSSNIDDYNRNNKLKIMENIIALFKYELTQDGDTIDKSSVNYTYSSFKKFMAKICETDMLNASAFDENNNNIFSNSNRNKIFNTLTATYA